MELLSSRMIWMSSESVFNIFYLVKLSWYIKIYKGTNSNIFLLQWEWPKLKAILPSLRRKSKQETWDICQRDCVLLLRCSFKLLPCTHYLWAPMWIIFQWRKKAGVMKLAQKIAIACRQRIHSWHAQRYRVWASLGLYGQEHTHRCKYTLSVFVWFDRHFSYHNKFSQGNQIWKNLSIFLTAMFMAIIQAHANLTPASFKSFSCGPLILWILL